MEIRDIERTEKQPAAIELPQRVHPIDARLHYNYIGSMNYDLSLVVTITVTCSS